VTAGPTEDRALAATTPGAADDPAALPSRVGRFVVLRAVGAGSMGVVVAAYDPVLDRQIALKLLRTGDSTAGDARLIQEAQAMARLTHPSVVTVHEAGAADGHVYLAMEFVDGGTLRGWLAAAPRTWREIRDRFAEAGRGLAAAHDAGLVHRDFKPDNVLIGRDGRARVTDFGLVRSHPVAPDGETGDPSGATGEATAVAGTPRYMAPEQHLGQRADARADQFAFCVALYEALWGGDPFAAPDAAARRARILRGDIAEPPAAPAAGRVPARLTAAVLRGLAADPARRHPTMRALLDAIARDPAIDRRRRLRLVAVALAGAGLATAINHAIPRTVATRSYPGEPDPRRFQLGIAMAWAPASPASSAAGDDAAALDRIVAAGGTASDLRFEWSAIEPVSGARDWSRVDHQLAELEQRGLEPFAYVGSAPAWLGRDRNAQCGEPYRNPPPGTDAGVAALREFSRSLAQRYCGRVKYYEFWDRANGCGWMSCGCGDQTPRQRQLYAIWLDEWSQAMREGCSEVVLAVGGLDCGWGGDPERSAAACAAFVDELYRNGASDAFDAIALRAGGDAADPAGALRGNKLINRAAILRVADALARHGNASRQLWIDGWGFPGAEPRLAGELVAAALAELRALPGVFAARHASIAELPEPAWRAFRTRALGPDTAWHGPINPGFEYQGEPPTEQHSSPMPSWGPTGGWLFHHRFPRDGDAALGRKAGFYAAGMPEPVTQTLTDAFVAERRYCFGGVVQGGRDNTGMLPLQIGYVNDSGRAIVLNTRVLPVDARWRDTPGVCFDARAQSPAIGRPIWIGLGAVGDGGASDIWFDNLRVTSTPLPAGH
jgi:hypothetical protein